MKSCSPWEGPQVVAGAECEEDRAAEMCDELTATPIPCPPAPLGGRRERKSQMKFSPGRREG